MWFLSSSKWQIDKVTDELVNKEKHLTAKESDFFSAVGGDLSRAKRRIFAGSKNMASGEIAAPCLLNV